MDKLEELNSRIEHALYLLKNDKSKEEVIEALAVPEPETKIVLTKSEFYKCVAEVMNEQMTKLNVELQTPYGLSKKVLDVTHFKGWKELTDKLWSYCARIN